MCQTVYQNDCFFLAKTTASDKKSNQASSHPSPGVWSRLDFHHPRDFAIIVDRKTEVMLILTSIQLSHDNSDLPLSSYGEEDDPLKC